MCTAIRLAFCSTATPRFLVHHSDGFFSALAQGDAGRLSQRSDEPRPHVAPSRMAEPRRRAPCRPVAVPLRQKLGTRLSVADGSNSLPNLGARLSPSRSAAKTPGAERMPGGDARDFFSSLSCLVPADGKRSGPSFFVVVSNLRASFLRRASRVDSPLRRATEHNFVSAREFAPGLRRRRSRLSSDFRGREKPPADKNRWPADRRDGVARVAVFALMNDCRAGQVSAARAAVKNTESCDREFSRFAIREFDSAADQTPPNGQGEGVHCSLAMNSGHRHCKGRWSDRFYERWRMRKWHTGRRRVPQRRYLVVVG